MPESIDNKVIKEGKPTVYVIQEITGTREGRPKINIMGAAEFGTFKFLLPEFSQIIFSPGPLIFKLRKGLQNYRPRDFLLLTGDPAIIGAQKFGRIEVLLREDTQIVRSPGPITYQLRRLLKDFTDKDYLLLSGDPKVIGLAIAVACDINNGKYKTLTWDKQEKMYYSTEFNIYERGEINEQDRL